MRNNFKNPVTGKEFSIAFVRTAYNKGLGCLMHFDADGEPLMDEDGTLLVPIENEVSAPSIRTPTKNR